MSVLARRAKRVRRGAIFILYRISICVLHNPSMVERTIKELEQGSYNRIE